MRLMLSFICSSVGTGRRSRIVMSLSSFVPFVISSLYPLVNTPLNHDVPVLPVNASFFTVICSAVVLNPVVVYNYLGGVWKMCSKIKNYWQLTKRVAHRNMKNPCDTCKIGLDCWMSNESKAFALSMASGIWDEFLPFPVGVPLEISEGDDWDFWFDDVH